MITVINKHHTFPICRGFPLGNPFCIGKDGSRPEVIEKYKTYLEEKIKAKDPVICGELNKIYSVALKYDIYLQCYCLGFSDNCHGLVIKDILLNKAKVRGQLGLINI